MKPLLIEAGLLSHGIAEHRTHLSDGQTNAGRRIKGTPRSITGVRCPASGVSPFSHRFQLHPVEPAADTCRAHRKNRTGPGVASGAGVPPADGEAAGSKWHGHPCP
ncbi:MAG: hypothetical protein LBK99_22875 [Opitutaceae bacterium]|nr:hypothetical protein [Opitutaceae bacterium]